MIFIAYLKMNSMQYDMFASALYSLALFFTFLLLFMYKNFLKIKFFYTPFMLLTDLTHKKKLSYNNKDLMEG